jgi:hypothetical protein
MCSLSLGDVRPVAVLGHDPFQIQLAHALKLCRAVLVYMIDVMHSGSGDQTVCAEQLRSGGVIVDEVRYPVLHVNV